ncbi:MAG: amidohydrolase family protein [Planctomycetota bacterium]|jgi:hypothetical protein
MLLICLGQSMLQAQDTGGKIKAVRVGKLHPVSGPSIENGVILVQGARILAVGAQTEIEVPADAELFDLPDAEAYPGLVDAMSGAFCTQRELANGAVDAGSRIIDGLDPYEPRSLELGDSGVTTAYVSNRSSSRWRGLGTILRPRSEGYRMVPGKEEAGLELLMSTGPNPMHALTRRQQLESVGKSFEALEAYKEAFSKHEEKSKEYEKKFAEYLEYHQKKKADKGDGAEETEGEARPRGGRNPGNRGGRRGAGNRGGRTRGGRGGRGGRRGNRGQPPAEEPKPEPTLQDPETPAPAEEKAGEKKAAEEKAPERPKYPTPPKKDPAKEAMLKVLAGDLPLRIEARRGDEVRAALELLRSQKIPSSLIEFADAAGPLAGELAAAGVPVLLSQPDPIMNKAMGLEETAGIAAQLASAGVPFAFTSGASVQRSRHLTLLAAMACGHGLSSEVAIRALTLTPAEILGIADQVGSLEAGKLADIVISSGPILASDSRILRVFSGGDLQYEAK